MVRAAPVPLVDLTRLPRHVAIIMDGNGRWAQQRGRPRTDGHRDGSRAVRRTVRAARRLGVPALTLYAFSEQNWDRPAVEVAALMELLRDYLESERQELVDNRIRLRAVGRRHKLPERVREVLDPLERETAELDGMVLTLCLSYGGREEITDATRALAAEVRAGHLLPDAIDERALGAHIHSMDVGPVDLLVRTGGEQRISNFVLWAAAYAELHFAPTLWPEYGAEQLYEAIAAFQKRERRFGRVPSDVESPGSVRDPMDETRADA
ncbi:MAG: polyprenyl diphosphate synthase [Myxococcota bacterium]